MEVDATTPDEWLDGLGDDAMGHLDRLIVASMPGRSRRLWTGTFWGGTEQSIIGYGDLVQSRPRGDDVEWFVVGLARQKRNYSLYVNAVEDGRYLGQHYEDRLGKGGRKVKIGSASIGFTELDDVDLDVLRELRARADELSPPDRGS